MPNKPKVFSVLIFALFIAFLTSAAFATIIRVPQDQPTIQAGIDAAVNGDTVLVAPGTYAEHINFNSKSILVKSKSGADSTIITKLVDGLFLVTMFGGESSNSILDGFKLTGSSTVAIDINSDAVIRNNIIQGNGGGIACLGGNPTIERNLIESNGTNYGVYLCSSDSAKVINNTIVFNSPGIYIGGCNTGIISNNIVYGNSSYGVYSAGGNPALKYNCVFANTSGNYSGIVPGPNDISVDPLFNGGTPFDYHLQINSPCIDTGDPMTLVPPGGGPRVDIGAFEFLYAPNFFLVSPLQDENLRLRQPIMAWSSLRHIGGIVPATYTVLLDENGDFSSADSSVAANDTTWKVSFKLSMGQTYFWRVIAVPDSGDTVVSPTRSFTILPPLLNLSSPDPANQLRLRQPSFVWQTAADSSISDSFIYFRVVFAKDISFAIADSSPVLTDTLWKVAYKLDLNQTYFWKVQAVSDSGDTIYSEEVRYFTVIPPTLSLNSPNNSERVLTKQPIFEWQMVRDTSIPDNFTYQVIYANNSSFTNLIASPVLSDTFWQVPAPLAIVTTYYWKVLVFYSAANDTLQSGTRNFLLAPTTIYVKLDRATIQEAIDIALNGDTVLVEPGIYQQNIFFSGKRIKLLSEDGPESTTISKLVDGAPLVSFNGSEDSTTVLRGFMLKGARLVSNGAAINVAGASPIIENNFIQDNQGDSAVIYVLGSSPKIRRNLIADNNTGLTAIGFFGGTGGEVINNTIANNTGDGIRITPSMMMRIKSNILAFNTGYGIRSIGGINNTSTVSYNDNFSNTLGTYFATIPTTGEIYQNPQFRGGSPFDYHLALGSPCIDSGDPGSPVPPGGGARVDIGAFEFLPTLGDLNGDGMFTPADVVLELNCVFLGTGNCPFNLADLNCDGQLTPTDVVLILNFVFLGSPPPC